MPRRPEKKLTASSAMLGVASIGRVIGASIFSAWLLSGCAGMFAYYSGKDLVAQDKVEEGLGKLQEAIAQAPQNLEYKKTYLQTRERAIYSYLEQADRFAAGGKTESAEKLYRRVLGIDPNNERAKAGLQNLERDERHDKLLKEGKTALDNKDVTTAKAKLATILAERPGTETSRALQRDILDKTASAPAESGLATAYRKPITIEFKDAPLKQIFEVISRTSGLNFLFDKDVKADQRTSIFLRNSTIESAIHFTLLTNQLEQQVLDGNTILIYPNTPAKIKDYQEMVVKSFFLANADAKTIANTLKTIVKSRDVVVDEKLNMVIVRDSPDAIRLADRLVALHDMPEPEVMLELEVLEIKRTRLLELGIQWPSSLTLTPLSTSKSGTLTLRDLQTNLNGGTIGAGVGSVNLRARKEDGDANLLANPRIRARNHEKAKILIGERVPNITTTATSTGFVSESVNYIDVGLKLDVEPTIYLDNEVAIKVSLEVSSVTNQLKTQSGSVAYQIGTRTASTVLRLKDGENQVLAGLINDEDRRTGNKVPGLGELPILGRLFGSSMDDNQKTEIVLSITPRLIRNIQRPDAAIAEFRSGTDTSFRTRPDTIAAPAALATLAQPSVKIEPKTSAIPQPPASSQAPTVEMNGSPANATNAATNTNAAVGARVANAAMPNALQAQWQGPTNVKPGSTFSVQLMLQSDQPVVTLPMTVGFDSKVFQVVNVVEGIFLKQGGMTTTFSSQVNPSGQITFTTARTGAGGATLPATAAVITFRAIAPAEAAQIQLLSAAPTGATGQPIPVKPTLPMTIQVQP